MSMTLEGLMNYYRGVRSISEATCATYECAVSQFIKVLRSRDKKISEYTIDDAIEFKQEILNRATPITFNSYSRSLSALFNYAVRREWMSCNPFNEVAKARVLEQRKKVVDLNILPDVPSRILGMLNAKFWPEDIAIRFSVFWSLVLRTFFYTGMRRRQLAGLNWADLMFEDSIIRLSSCYSKTGSERSIPMPEQIWFELWLLKQEIIRIRGYLPMDEQVFNVRWFLPERYAKNIQNRTSPAYFTHYLKRFGYKAEIHITPHRLRHTVATELCKKQQNLRCVQELLGHSDIRMTAQYAHPDLAGMRLMLSSLI